MKGGENQRRVKEFMGLEVKGERNPKQIRWKESTGTGRLIPKTLG